MSYRRFRRLVALVRALTLAAMIVQVTNEYAHLWTQHKWIWPILTIVFLALIGADLVDFGRMIERRKFDRVAVSIVVNDPALAGDPIFLNRLEVAIRDHYARRS